MQTLHNIHSKFNDGFWRLLGNLFNVNSSLLATNQNRSLHTRKIKYNVVKEKNQIFLMKKQRKKKMKQQRKNWMKQQTRKWNNKQRQHEWKIDDETKAHMR